MQGIDCGTKCCPSAIGECSDSPVAARLFGEARAVDSLAGQADEQVAAHERRVSRGDTPVTDTAGGTARGDTQARAHTSVNDMGRGRGRGARVWASMCEPYGR